MNIPDDIRKCVVFVGAKRSDGTYSMLGSAFFLGRDAPGTQMADPCYAITARHVIDRVRTLGATIVGLRMNVKGGDATWHDTKLEEWVYRKDEPTVDVAMREMGIPVGLDHLAVPYSMCVNQAVMIDNDVGPGDEVFVTGLFRHHHGAKRNIPIIRVGALACLGEERVTTAYGEMDAVLIEARSIGGLSGSPVFLHLGLSRAVKGQLKFTQGQTFFLLGLVHGHYDALDANLDDVEADGEGASRLTNSKINTGIAIVVPFHSIDDVVERYERRKSETPSFDGNLGFTPFQSTAS